MLTLSWLGLHIVRALVFVVLGLVGDFEAFIHFLEYLLNRMADALDYMLGLYQ